MVGAIRSKPIGLTVKYKATDKLSDQSNSLVGIA